MKKLFISQPMRGKGDEEILRERQELIEKAERIIGEPVETIDSFFHSAPADAKPLWFLGKSLELLANADVAIFADDFQDARGCRIEHMSAVEYGIDRIEPNVEPSDERKGLAFQDAYALMKAGAKIKLPSWGGYWYWDTEKKTIVIHTKDGDELDIRKTERPEYTFNNICSNEWVIADEENCPELGGEVLFGFEEAVKYIKRGLKVARKGWNGKGQYVFLATNVEFDTRANMSEFNPCGEGETGQCNVWVDDVLVLRNAQKDLQPGWMATQSDLLAEDWTIVEEPETDE